jgi:hypothetical protein
MLSMKTDRAEFASKLATMMIAFATLLFSATAAQAIYVDLSGVDLGTTTVEAEGHSLVVESIEYEHTSRWYGDITIELVSVTFVDEPVALDSISLVFSDSSTRILGNVMGEQMIIESTGPGLNVVDMGGIEGQKVALAGFGGTSLNLAGIEFNVAPVAGTVPVSPGSPVPEPQAALLFSVALGVVAARRRF